MPRNNENQHVEVTPHFDGEKESIINDPTASAGTGIGITMEFEQKKNPFNTVLKQDQGMKQLGKLIGGNKVEE